MPRSIRKPNSGSLMNEKEKSAEIKGAKWVTPKTLRKISSSQTNTNPKPGIDKYLRV
jgi:hypothetical protein